MIYESKKLCISEVERRLFAMSIMSISDDMNLTVPNLVSVHCDYRIETDLGLVGWYPKKSQCHVEIRKGLAVFKHKYQSKKMLTTDF